jgi:hypothetical protein
MAVRVEMHNTGATDSRGDLVAMIEHLLSDRPGNWRVVITGSQENEQWDMKITGPNAFERGYTLEVTIGQHEPSAVAAIIARMLPSRT